MMGYLLGPLAVGDDPGSVPTLLFITLGIAAATLVAAVCWCPDRPCPRTSSDDGVLLLGKRESSSNPPFVRSVLMALANPSVLLLVLAGGMETGANSAWGGVLPQLIS